MSFDLNKHVRAAGRPLQEDSGSSKKAWQSRDRGSGGKDDPAEGSGNQGFDVNAPQTNQALADALQAGMQGDSNQAAQVLVNSQAFVNADQQSLADLANGFKEHAQSYPDEAVASQAVSTALWSMADGMAPDYSGNMDGLANDMGIDPTQMTETVNEALDGIIRRNR